LSERARRHPEAHRAIAKSAGDIPLSFYGFEDIPSGWLDPIDHEKAGEHTPLTADGTPIVVARCDP